MSEMIWQWSATETARAIRTGLVSSREVTESVLERIQSANAQVNALVETSADEALAAADAADLALSSGHLMGPLHGIPVSIKVNTDQAGHATTDGVAAFRNNLVKEDAPHVANWRAAGAVLIGRSNTPAFSIRWFADNELHGRTLNPWNAARTPGGSSGGAAVAVATGMGALAQGNDIGGSIRYPAAACGVVGMRPTPGRVPTSYGPKGQDAPLAAQTMGVEGPLARTVADARLGLATMSAWRAEDPFCVPVPLNGSPLGTPIRVGIVRDTGIVSPDPAVDAAVTRAGHVLADAGYAVEEVDLPLLAEAHRLWWQLVQGVEFRTLLPLIEKFGDAAIRHSVENQFAYARTITQDFSLEAYLRGYARRATLIRNLQLFLEDYPILLTPVSAERTFEVDADLGGPDRFAQMADANWPMMSVALLGFPALSVPVTAADGLPIGVQLIGQKFREDVLFDAGEVIEAHSNVVVPLGAH